MLHSGQVLPAAHTSGPVQLDRVLSSLNTNARTNLQTLLQGFGAALNDKPTAAADSTADPSQRGLTAAQSLNRSLDYSAAAFRASALVDQALLGETPHDLSGSVTGLSKTFTGLNESGSHLAGPRHLVQQHDGRAGRAPERSLADDRAAAGHAARRRRRARAAGGLVRADPHLRA